MRWHTVLLKGKPGHQQLIAVLDEFRKKMTNIMRGVNFSFLVDKMQPLFDTKTNAKQKPSCAELILRAGLTDELCSLLKTAVLTNECTLCIRGFYLQQCAL